MMDSILICRLIIDKSTCNTTVLFRLHGVMCIHAAFDPVFCYFVTVLRFVRLNGALQ